MDTILEVFFLPPMAIARLGSSDKPMESFTWTEDPSVFGGDMTIITPQVSLEVREDGSLCPDLPQSIRFRDGKSLRPVAPFFELWVTVQSGKDGTIKEVPLTLNLLTELGASTENIRYRITAGNRKASFRTGDPACSYTAMVEVAGQDCQRYPLLAYSRHTAGQEPLVLKDHPIPLGHFQVMRPTPETKLGVDLSQLRVRFTPAKGKVYGPPSAIAGPASGLPPGEAAAPLSEAGRVHEIVSPENRILNENTVWSKYILGREYDDALPSDSYDGANVGDNSCWGVVDDSCDAVIEAYLAIASERYVATARVLVGPPDFAPDRRPFYSIADDLADRDLDSVQVNKDTEQVTAEEIQDLFHRIYETISLMSLDSARTRSIRENDSNEQKPNFRDMPQIDKRSLSGEDVPYVDKSPDLLISSAPQEESISVKRDRLPYKKVAHFVHTPLTDIDTLIHFFRTHQTHIERLIRPPFGHFHQLTDNPPPNSEPNPDFRDPRILRDKLYDMRMPPYMRDSDANPLSLTRRQYEELMALVKLLNEPQAK